MNPLSISDIFITVCNNLELKEIINLELLSINHQLMVRNNNWYKQINIKNDIILDHILKNYKLKKLNINNNCNINIFIDKLKNCHTLDLSYTKITYKCIVELKLYDCIINK